MTLEKIVLHERKTNVRYRTKYVYMENSRTNCQSMNRNSEIRDTYTLTPGARNPKKL